MDNDTNAVHHEAGGATDTTATSANVSTDSTVATTLGATSSPSSSSASASNTVFGRNIIELLQGIANNNDGTIEMFYNQAKLHNNGKDNNNNNSNNNDPSLILMMISGEVSSIMKQFQQGNTRLPEQQPEQQQQQQSSSSRRRRQQQQQQPHQDSIESMTMEVSSSTSIPDPNMAYWYLKAATKLLTIYASLCGRGVSSSSSTTSSMVSGNDYHQHDMNPFSSNKVTKDITNSATLQDVLEAVGSCVTFCQPRSLISESGIIPVLQMLLPPTKVTTSNKETIHAPNLSTVHVEFLQVCIYAEQYQYANAALYRVWPIPRKGISVKSVLRYFYLRGIVHIACGEIDIAIRCFETCLTIPADVVSAIAVASWKKYVLLQCLRHTFDVTSSYGTGGVTTTTKQDQDITSSVAASTIRDDDDEEDGGVPHHNSVALAGSSFGMGLLSEHDGGEAMMKGGEQRKQSSTKSSLSFLDTIIYPKDIPKCSRTFFDEAFNQKENTTTSTTTGGLKYDDPVDSEANTVMHIVESNVPNRNTILDDMARNQDRKQPQNQSLPNLGVKVYYDLLQSFISIDRVKFNTIFRDDELTRTQLLIDGNYGLVKRCHDALIRRHIVALSTLFASISIPSLQLHLYLESMDEVITILQDLSTKHEWNITIDFNTNFVSFPRFPSSKAITTSMITKYNNADGGTAAVANGSYPHVAIVQELVELHKLMDRYNVDISSSQEYCRAVSKDITNSINKRSESLKKHGPRGVEDLS